MIDHRVWHKDHWIAPRGEAEGELLIFYRGGREEFVKAAVLQKNFARVSRTVSIYKINPPRPFHVRVFFLVLELHKARDQFTLSSGYTPLAVAMGCSVSENGASRF